MSYSLLLTTPSLELRHDVAHTCLYAHWRFQTPARSALLSYQHILLGAQQAQPTKLLNDCWLTQDGWQEVATWLAHDCFQELAQVGIRTIAWVLPHPPPDFLATRLLLQEVPELLVDTFTDAEAAYEWLHRW